MAPEDDLRQLVAELSARVASLEAAVRGLRPDFPGPIGASVAPGPPSPSPLPPPKPATSLESRIGAQLLNRIGIVAVLIGMAWFLKLAMDRNWIGPEVRVLIGLACAVALTIWSERFRRRGFTAFSYSLKALGTSIAYLSLWAAFSLFHLAPYGLVFLAMTGVTIANAVLARRQNSELLAMYALAGGLATPGLLSMGHDSAFFLFSYLALLNGGALLLFAVYPWKRLAWAGLGGTAVYYLGWSQGVDEPSRMLVTACFLGLFFVNFAAVTWLILRQDNPPGSLFPAAFVGANGLATWEGLMILFGAVAQHPVRPWVTVGLAVACLLLAGVSRSAAMTVSNTYLGLGIVFVTVAIPMEYHGYVVNLCWLGESLVLVLAARSGSRAAMRQFAVGVLAITAFSLLVDWVAGTRAPLAVAANAHFFTNLVGAAVFAAITVISLDAWRAHPGGRGFGSWAYLAGFACVAFGLTIVVTVCLEIHHYWFCGAGFWRDYCGGYGQLERRAMNAEFSYSGCCMLYGAGLMAMGFLRRSAFLRWQALGLLAFSIGMVFFSAVSHESQGYRVFSFLALGVLLLAVSFAYQKDWLRLRG